MSLPQNEVKIQPVSIDGLEEVFETADSPAQDRTPAQDNPAQVNAEAMDSPAQDWTVSEAAGALGVSEKTVLRRLQRGSLLGYKVSGQFGPEWRINRIEGSPAQDRAPAQDSPPQVNAEVVDSPAQDILIDELRDELHGLRKQLEAAIYRNGYLEAKLEERETSIKLLTDSQHKQQGWWARFASWFVRSQQ